MYRQKNNRIRIRFLFFSILTFMPFVANKAGFCGSGGDQTMPDQFQKVNYFIDFSDYESGSVENWLREKGFKFERDARDRKKLDLDISENGLILGAKRPMFGIMVNEGVDLEEFTSIRIEWGINRYPEGAS